MTEKRDRLAPEVAHAAGRPFQLHIYRATIAQEARIIVGPTDIWRNVQIAVPSSAGRVFVAPDVWPSVLKAGTGVLKRPPPPKRSPDGLSLDMSDQAIGYNRSYKMPEFTSGVGTLEFPLAPAQWLTAMASAGVVTLSLIVHPMDAPMAGLSNGPGAPT